MQGTPFVTHANPGRAATCGGAPAIDGRQG